MVTQREKALIYTMTDMLMKTVEILNGINKIQGIEKEPQFISDCREAIGNGYAVINGNSETRETKLINF